MKKVLLVLALLGCLLSPVAAVASVGIQDTDGAYAGEATHIRGSVSFDGTTSTLGQETCIPFDVSEFIGVDNTANVTFPLSTSTSPKLAYKNSVSVIAWNQDETHPAQKTFKVPSKYSSGGNFKVFLNRTADDTSVLDDANIPGLDFEVFVNSSGTAFDSAATNQTPVKVGLTEAGHPVQKTLTVDTDFASLSAGDVVTLNIWREASGTDGLNFYGGEFCYVQTN